MNYVRKLHKIEGSRGEIFSVEQNKNIEKLMRNNKNIEKLIGIIKIKIF